MKLLILTQKIDLEDPILGFFHNWVSKLSKKYESIIVICLEKGKYNLPSNVSVFSLGKESGRSKIKYMFNFYKYVWLERVNYQKVFVHMNQEYIILGGILWKILGKDIFMWRNHKIGNIFTNIAVAFCDRVFCTSEFSYTKKFKKTILMPVGIDTYIYQKNDKIKTKPNSILALGRISRIKRLDILIKALLKLEERGVLFEAMIVGSADSVSDRKYEKELYLLASSLIKSGKLKFIPAVSPEKTVDFYQSHEIYVNLTPAGSMDKTIFEAMSCEMLVVTKKEDVVLGLDKDLIDVLSLSSDEKINQGLNNRKLVESRHSLSALSESLCGYI